MFSRTTFNLFAIMLHMSQGLGLGMSGKISIRLIGTALLSNSTPTGNTVIVIILSICNIVILVGKNSLLRNSVTCYFML